MSPSLAVFLVLQGTAAAAEGPVSPGIPRDVRPLPQVDHGCVDSRYPRLTGRFVLFCGPTGQPDRVLDLRTGATTVLEQAAEAWALHQGRLYGLGRERGVWVLPEARPQGPGDRALDAQTPPAWDGAHAAYGSPRGLVVFTPGQGTQRVLDAHPAPWQPPALGAGRVAWTEVHDSDAELWVADVDHGRPELLAGGAGLQHHPVGSAEALAWVDQGDVVVWTAEGQRRLEAEAGFDSAPVLWGRVVCWGDRGDGTLVVRCDDGWSAPGRRPSGGGPLILAHTDSGPVLYTARWWPARVEQGLVRVSDWWGTGAVRVEEQIVPVQPGVQLEVAVHTDADQVRVYPVEVSG